MVVPTYPMKGTEVKGTGLSCPAAYTSFSLKLKTRHQRPTFGSEQHKSMGVDEDIGEGYGAQDGSPGHCPGDSNI